MASRKEQHSRLRPDGDARALVFVPCPNCGRGVRLSDENRVTSAPDAYECPTCGARLVFSES